ncbi:MAG: hypothetical protein QXU47_08965 [Candidatus Bathyarchaeia archaeon]
MGPLRFEPITSTHGEIPRKTPYFFFYESAVRLPPVGWILQPDCLVVFRFNICGVEVRGRINIAAFWHGYILTSSNSIHRGVKLSNAIAMYKAGRKFGVYVKR